MQGWVGWKTGPKRYIPTWKTHLVIRRMEKIYEDREEMTFLTENPKCECGHALYQHFQTQDSLGWWSFCLIEDCPCFKDLRDEEEND